MSPCKLRFHTEEKEKEMDLEGRTGTTLFRTWAEWRRILLACQAKHWRTARRSTAASETTVEFLQVAITCTSTVKTAESQFVNCCFQSISARELCRHIKFLFQSPQWPTTGILRLIQS